METKLDNFDKKVLYELDKDSSISLKDLSKKIGRTKQFIHFRIKKLEEEGILEGYNAIVDMSKLGYFTFRLYFDFQNFIEEDEKKFVAFLKKDLPQVWTITRMHGKWDYAVFIGVRTIKEFHEVWDSILFHYKEKIKQYNVSLYSPIFNFNRKIYLEKADEVVQRRYGDGEKEDLDEFDIKLIHAYAVNVRQSYLELANKLKVSHDKISERIKKLEKKKVIVGYTIGLNLSKLGFQGYRVDLELNSTKKNSELFDYCLKHKYIYQVNKSIGGANFEIEVIVRDLNHLNELIEEIKRTFRDAVKDVEYFGFSTFYLLKFIPD
jgi:DNA-binding Lrp family transcriptional regulator